MAATITFWQYIQRVQREAGLRESASFPTAPTTEEKRVFDAINSTLREINVKYYLCFQLTEYALTTIAGQTKYRLAEAPYNLQFFDISRIARNGVIRAFDGLPLEYVDYTQVDMMRPTLTSSGIVTFYSAFGDDLILFPKPDGSQVTVRYYGSHIGTTANGLTKKQNLTLSTDLTMLDDNWQDALVYGAACKTFRVDSVNEKYMELKALWEGWLNSLNGMSKPAGEDARPRFNIDQHDTLNRSRYFPFGTGYAY